jgi:hypothetical protein
MSTPSERLFSSAGYQVCERRNKISPVNKDIIKDLVDNSINTVTSGEL